MLTLKTLDERHFAAEESAIFLIAFYLLRLEYFLAFSKSILIHRRKCRTLDFAWILFLRYSVFSSAKKWNFCFSHTRPLIRTSPPSQTLPRIVGKWVSSSLAIPAAHLIWAWKILFWLTPQDSTQVVRARSECRWDSSWVSLRVSYNFIFVWCGIIWNQGPCGLGKVTHSVILHAVGQGPTTIWGFC